MKTAENLKYEVFGNLTLSKIEYFQAGFGNEIVPC